MTPEQIEDMLKRKKGSLNRKMRIGMCESIIEDSKTDDSIPKEAVFAAEKMLEFETCNDQMMGILATAKSILAGFDPDKEADFTENFNLIKKLTVLVIAPIQMLGDNLHAIHESLQEHRADVEAMAKEVAEMPDMLEEDDDE